MTDQQYLTHVWLSRMWDADVEIKQLEAARQSVISSLSGIGKYEADYIPSQTGENSTETKNIQFSIYTEQLEKRLNEYITENRRTLAVIDKVDDTMLRGMLEAYYINHDRYPNWTEVGKLYNYEKTQTYKKYRDRALDAVYPFIPLQEAEFLKVRNETE